MERQGSPSSSSCRRNSAMHLLRIDETVVVGRRGQGIVLIPPCDSASTFRDPRNYICWGLFFSRAPGSCGKVSSQQPLGDHSRHATPEWINGKSVSESGI